MTHFVAGVTRFPWDGDVAHQGGRAIQSRTIPNLRSTENSRTLRHYDADST
jgi:hypothetical protein